MSQEKRLLPTGDRGEARSEAWGLSLEEQNDGHTPPAGASSPHPRGEGRLPAREGQPMQAVGGPHARTPRTQLRSGPGKGLHSCPALPARPGPRLSARREDSRPWPKALADKPGQLHAHQGGCGAAAMQGRAIGGLALVVAVVKDQQGPLRPVSPACHQHLHGQWGGEGGSHAALGFLSPGSQAVGSDAHQNAPTVHALNVLAGLPGKGPAEQPSLRGDSKASLAASGLLSPGSQAAQTAHTKPPGAHKAQQTSLNVHVLNVLNGLPVKGLATQFFQLGGSGVQWKDLLLR